MKGKPGNAGLVLSFISGVTPDSCLLTPDSLYSGTNCYPKHFCLLVESRRNMKVMCRPRPIEGARSARRERYEMSVRAGRWHHSLLCRLETGTTKGRGQGGRGVAGGWRIRHKLMLGMGLVGAIMALLLAGTLKGLASYQSTRRTIDSKLTRAGLGREAARRPPRSWPTPAASTFDARLPSCSRRSRMPRRPWPTTRASSTRPCSSSRDPDQGFQEKQHQVLEQRLRPTGEARNRHRARSRLGFPV